MQLGLPMEKAQYIHRLGRTARAGKSGKGLIILGERFLPCWHGLSSGIAMLPHIDRSSFTPLHLLLQVTMRGGSCSRCPISQSRRRRHRRQMCWQMLRPRS